MKKITLFGGSGTMGFETFKHLWRRRQDCEITLLLRPSKKNRKLFRPYIGKSKKDSLRIIWGDGTNYEDVKTAVKGTDYVLDAMAFISPQADYYPERAKAVNIDCISNLIKAIGEEPDGNSRIKLAYTGTVAETGDRLPPIHWGRTGDPLKPSIFDFYAVTKIAGERLVLESDIKHWASLRLTYIMPVSYKGLRALTDPIMFHMPLNSCMENISSRDAGLGMANVIDVPDNSGFWRKIYNMGGGPGMRITAHDFSNRMVKLFGGSGLKAVSDRRWFATGNFHMQYYADSFELNKYLNYWHDSFESWINLIKKDMPGALKIISRVAGVSKNLSRRIDAETRKSYEALAKKHKNGTFFWRKTGNTKRLDAFYGGKDAWDALPGWDAPLPEMHQGDSPSNLLNHGYDESKPSLGTDDLRQAADFRGGRCLTENWSGDMFEKIEWKCAFGHTFMAKPNTVLKGGHWCPECEAPDWDFKKIAGKNPFFNQVIEPFIDAIPAYPIKESDLSDITPEETAKN
ncbi:MAG: NAD(P)-dependent oxidoreductase [Spirochaetales bacterium]|nr:NAD(P)-dependent oxidoreductase [Spirochaetales bacterium]